MTYPNFVDYPSREWFYTITTTTISTHTQHLVTTEGTTHITHINQPLAVLHYHAEPNQP